MALHERQHPSIPGDSGISWYELTDSFLRHANIDLPIRPPHGKGYVEALPLTDLISSYFHLTEELSDSKQRLFVWYYNTSNLSLNSI